MTEVREYSFEWINASEDLRPFLNSLYVLRVGDKRVEDFMPAYSGQVVVRVSGGGTMQLPGGPVASSPAYLQGPLTRAHPFVLEPGTIMYGISLNFRGWFAFTGLPADVYSDTAHDVVDVLPETIASRLASLGGRIAANELTEEAAIAELENVVRTGLRDLPERHKNLIDVTLEWLSSSLNPEVQELYDTLPFSKRQIQRLIMRFFGQSPKRLTRRYRAIRAATMLSLPDLDDKLRTEVVEAFFDQPHMVNELRYFTGKTPRSINHAQDSVVNEMLGTDGYSSVDVFGGSEDEALRNQ